MDLHCERGGPRHGPLLLLLHGLGGNSGAWERMLEFVDADWRGPWLAPDLRGHGASPHALDYSLEAHVRDVDALLGSGPVVALGHSMGGAIAIRLAATLRADLRVAAFSVKNSWDETLLARLRQASAAPVRHFASETEARERAVAAAGLRGIVDAGCDLARRGVREHAGAWTLALDMRVHDVAGACVQAEAESLGSRLQLARGETDAMVGPSEWSQSGVPCGVIAGAGHNPQFDAPAALWAQFRNFLG